MRIDVSEEHEILKVRILPACYNMSILQQAKVNHRWSEQVSAEIDTISQQMRQLDLRRL